MVKIVLAALALLCMLTACDSTQSLEQLRTQKPTGDAYQSALATGYREDAEQRAERYDWATSKYFADKGLMAAYAREVTPEDPAQWNIPAGQLPELVEARGKLMNAITENRSTQPEMTASAVLAYDRWVVLVFNQWSQPKIDDQRDTFFAILTKLSEAHTATVETPTTTTPVETTSAVLYFPMDSDNLGDSALTALDQLVRYVKSAGNVTVNINGHADRVGSEQYNMDLSQRRAVFVLHALEKAGIPSKVMKYFAFGESDPAVPTADGVAEPKNRRVEIFVE